ncbi:ubiquinol-cytochrome c reductase iron-sulfur subunit [Shewanella avicenniae]|uniref:Ubiquinol-cytochrome c reductase iron-sulfur subunit n=1 Tax=Shewanella avicenniae TaxID=2814294 RepID=A0ABX7QS92_9GAMM|nr:ubiquinol-cytochrome c reductase iron-sulfur subunit [Shewanella avicenniae]QSX34336.1 ubiquinol-cytochrome c reductase iron-sulfur subunit [Shewanella avicenniae]
MSSSADFGRRRILALTTIAVGGAGIAAASVPFLKSWNPSAKAKAASVPVEVNISKLEPGQLIKVMWRGRPVWVVKRPQAMLDALAQHEELLRDPQSVEPQQPKYAQNPWRSIKPEIFVAIGICTHLGCSPNYQPDSFSEHVDQVIAGFFCPCHGSGFDMAGRVFQGVPAPLNLVVPPHKFVDDNLLVIGVDQEPA